MARRPTPPPKLRMWRISIMRAKAQYVGQVEALDEKLAIAKAVEEFNIAPARRFRLIAEPVE